MHNDYDIWLIFDGEVTIEVNASTYHGGEGDILFFYPGMPYTAYMGQKGCRFVYIHFDFGIGNNYRILDDFGFAGVIPAKLLREEAKVFRKGWNRSKKSDVTSILLKGYFTVLVSRIIEVCSHDQNRNNCFPPGYKQKNAVKVAVLQPVFKYISENMGKKIKISELSNIACISEKYFINYFKDAIGISPLVYINQLKMNRARNYIYQRKYSIKQISDLLGYSDQYTFSKTFKKYFNVSPSNFI